jgi:hypothetical protein
MKVKVYFNLHRHLFSVVALEGPSKGRVVAHRSVLRLANARFKVSEAGRQRVLREKRKNVHAFVVGELCEMWVHPEGFRTREATYNPYVYSTFVLKDSQEPIFSADCVWLEGKRIKVLDK